MTRKLALVVPFVLLALTGCVRVGVAGDSITWLAKDEIDAKLRSKSYVVSAASMAYLDTAEITAKIREAEQRDGRLDYIIANAGTNDIQRNITFWAWDYNALIAELEDADCAGLVTINRAADARGNGTVTSTDINARIVSEVAKHPHFRLIDWATAVTLDPTLLDPSEPLHPSQKGQNWLADQYAQTLDFCLNL